MSHRDDTLQAALEQHLEALKSGEDRDDWMRDLLEWLLQELLDLEFDEHVGAERYERTKDRRGYRNGYYARDLFTRVGRLSLRVPRDRQGKFSTELFERYQRSEKALVLALQESYLQGVSTRKVKKITEKLCGVRFSKDQVSSMAKELDDQLETWRNRPLTREYLYLVVDAHYEYVREDGQVQSDAALIVKGVREDDYREILAVFVAPAEEKATWSRVFSDLIDRGLDPRAVRCITSDDHKGMRKAIQRYFPRASWHRCQTHYQRNAGGYVSAKARDEVHAGLRDVFKAPDRSQALARAERLMDAWRSRFPELVAWLEKTLEEALTVFNLPEGHRKRMRTTNALERFYEEVGRRARVIRIFPNRASYLRLASALAMEQSEEWISGHRYLDMSMYREDEIEEQPAAEQVPERQLVKA
jgi:transposase-like protein